MTYEELVEIAEEAIRDVHDLDVTMRDYASAAVSAIAKHAAIMPREATEDMMEASARTHDPAAWDRMIEDALDYHSGEIPQWAFQAKMEAQRRYKAMLAAGEIKPVKEG